jgi:GAF domain-containing protein
MTYDPAIHTLVTPVDREAPKRVRRLRELGLGDTPDPDFDEFALKLAQITDAPYAMVNFISENRQYFAGLYGPRSTDPKASPVRRGEEDPDRVMDKDHGWCPHVVVRRLALVLDDVCAYPRFVGNPVIDKIGIRAYLGAPLIERASGMTLGTICVIDTQQRQWGRDGLKIIKTMAADMVERIDRRTVQLQR